MTPVWFLVLTDDEQQLTKVIRYRKTPRGLVGMREDAWDAGGAGRDTVGASGLRWCCFRAESVEALKRTHGSWFYPTVAVQDALEAKDLQ